jgi:hypothetical protein
VIAPRVELTDRELARKFEAILGHVLVGEQFGQLRIMETILRFQLTTWHRGGNGAKRRRRWNSQTLPKRLQPLQFVNASNGRVEMASAVI